MLKLRILGVAAALVFAGLAAADLTTGLDKKGAPEIKSAGPLAFGPDGVLFVGDPAASMVYAVDTGDRTPARDAKQRPKVEDIDGKVAALLGVEAKQLQIADIAVNPISGNVYMSVARGKGPDAKPVILKMDRAGKIDEFKPAGNHGSAKLANPTEKKREEAITDLAFVKGRLIVAGLSSEEFASKLRAVPYPFKEGEKATSIEIYHGAHGALETRAPVRTFVAYDVGGETNLLAAYTCTPLVRIPVSQLKAGEKVKGTTVAELGNMNRPLDMIVYKKDGKDYLLLANSARGVMKIPLEGVDKAEAITSRISGKAGLKYDTIDALKGVEQLDRFDDTTALILTRGRDGKAVLETVELP